MTAPARDLTWSPHIRLAWGGTLGDPELEIWSNSLKFRTQDLAPGVGGPVPDHGALQTACDSAATILSGWMTDTSSHISSAAKLTYVKCNWIGSDGLQLDQNTVQTDVTPAVAGVGDEIGPWYVSYVLTLRTALRRGRSHSGRIYPPVTNPVILSGSPYITVADADEMATAFARIVYALNVAMPGGGGGTPGTDPVVLSPGSTERGTLPLSQPITGVVCDRVGDVMHSRTRSVPRSEGAVIVPGP